MPSQAESRRRCAPQGQPRQRWGRAAYYSARAEEAKTIADGMDHDRTRASLLQIAALWEAMATLEEKSPTSGVLSDPVLLDGTDAANP